MITCNEALELLSAQLDGAITIEEQTALQEHLAACPECRRIQSELRMADEALPGLQQEPPKPRQLLVTKEQWQAMQSGQQMQIPEEDYKPPVEEEIL